MPLLQKQYEPLRGVWKLNEHSDELLSILSNPSVYESFLQRVNSEHRRCEWLASRVLIKELLEREALIAYHPNGAPFLLNESLAVSISHTKGYVAVLLQESYAAGVDIEYRSARIHKIRSRFMTPDEEAGIDPAHETEHLLIHWCAKETLFKMIGQEQVDFRRHLHIEPFTYANSGVFIVHETRTPACASFELGFQVSPDFVMTWSLSR